MNPLPLVVAELRRNRGGSIAVVALIAVAVAVGVAIGAQERALRTASARAADRFDLVVGAPGSPLQLVLTTAYLQPAPLELLPPETLARLQQERGVRALAPVAVTDSWHGYPVVGTTAAFATDDGRLGPSDGRRFEQPGEAMVGADVDVAVGSQLRPLHGSPAENLLETHAHDAQLTVVGRLSPTGTPWDRAIVVPIETVWAMHDRGTAHDATLGPPWPAPASVPAVVVRPESVADAYRLRQAYRGHGTMALFPAEVLNPLYAVLGDVRDLMRAMALVFDALLLAAILLAIAAVLAARRQSVGVLRALGAPRRFVVATVWLHGALLVVAGSALGLLLGAVGARVVATVAGHRLGLAVDAAIGVPEVLLVLAIAAVGSLLAALPTLALLRAPVRRLLQDA
jgi:putative ABC transport system permease protein